MVLIVLRTCSTATYKRCPCGTLWCLVHHCLPCRSVHAPRSRSSEILTRQKLFPPPGSLSTYGMARLLHLLTPIALATTVAGNACVVGGPVSRVSSAKACCNDVSGKWFAKYANQGICVMTAAEQVEYQECIKEFAPNYHLVCIECDETTDCGLAPTE